MEGFPQPENSSEKMPPTGAEVLEAIKANGIEDEATRALYIEWLDAEEARIEAIPNKPESGYAITSLAIEKAEMMYAAGMLEEAYDDLIETDMNQNDSDIAPEHRQKIRALANKISDELKS